MKSTPSELISTLRKKTSRTNAIIIVSILIAWVLSFVLVHYIKELSFLSQPSLSALFILLIFYFWERRITYMEIFDGTPENVLSAFEAHLQKEYNASLKRRKIKFGVFGFLTLAVLFMIIYKRHSEWTTFMSVAWIAGILSIYLQSWLLMKDQMLLQDIKHCMRNQTSDIS